MLLCVERLERNTREKEKVCIELLFNLCKPFVVEIKQCVLSPLSSLTLPRQASPIKQLPCLLFYGQRLSELNDDTNVVTNHRTNETCKGIFQLELHLLPTPDMKIQIKSQQLLLDGHNFLYASFITNMQCHSFRIFVHFHGESQVFTSCRKFIGDV